MVYVSESICSGLRDYLTARGYGLFTIRSAPGLSPEVRAHPDIYLCRLGARGDAPALMAGEGELGYGYPAHAGYNAVCLERYFVHCLRYTAPRLVRAAERLDLRFVDVRQGYAKCSCVVVDGNSVITSDRGILKALRALPEVETLEVRPGYVRLRGMPSGFLGGASGRVGDEILFNGNLESHPDCAEIADFIRSRGLRPVWFPEAELEDTGSVIQCSGLLR